MDCVVGSDFSKCVLKCFYMTIIKLNADQLEVRKVYNVAVSQLWNDSFSSLSFNEDTLNP